MHSIQPWPGPGEPADFFYSTGVGRFCVTLLPRVRLEA